MTSESRISPTNLISPLITAIGLASGAVHAEPTISSISGSITDSGTLVVNGSGFGAGPTVILYDDFNGGVTGDTVPLKASGVGNWTETVGKAPIYSATARSGSTSMRTYYDGRTAQFKKDFPTPATEVFLSFWVRIPENTPFPGSSGGVRSFSSDSSWKMAWLIDSSYDGSTSDLSVPTHTGSGSFYFAGNDYTLAKLANGSNWWSWNSWMRMTVWLRADPDNPTAAGEYLFQVVSQERGLTAASANAPVFDSDGPSQKVFRYLNLPGWIRSDGDSQPAYDDVYLAAGANAQARVEISDSATYAGSKHLALLVPQSWTSSRIEAKLPPAATKSGQLYLYVTDKDGLVNAEGYPLDAGALPNPPTQLVAN